VKAKLTCYLDPALARALRLASADRGIPQGDIVAAALRTLLANPKGTPSAVALDALQQGPGAALEVAQRLRTDGARLNEIAARLNADGYRTRNGRRWNTVSASRLLAKR